MISVDVHATAHAFLARAESWLMAREDRHNLMLGLVGGDHDEAWYATVDRHGELQGCVMRTPPHKVLVTDLPADTAPAVAGAMAEEWNVVPAILGPAPTAEAIAAQWVAIRGGSWWAGMEQRIYRLDEVTAPDGVPGSLRKARADELDLAVSWGEGFARDAGVAFAARGSVKRWITREALHVWEVDGLPVSIAVAHGRTRHGVRIGYVYTPPRHRGRGFASACVAALSQKELDGGTHFCVLYTDLANPRSNAIYQRVGYVPIADVRDVNLVPAEVA